MRHEKPLLFITSPIIRKYRYTPIVEEESTSVFEPEHSREIERLEIPSLSESPSTEKIQETPASEEPIRQSLEYLHHPFRKELYAPIEIVTENDRITGKLHNLEDEVVWITTNEDTTSIRIEEIRDILWKQQSFTI